MRNLLLCSLVLTAAPCAVLGDRATTDPTKTAIAYPLKAAPTIDGVISTDEWLGAGGNAGDYWAATVVLDAEGNTVIRGGAIGDAGTVPVDSADLSFAVYAGYDAQNLYIAVRVKDDVLSNDDAQANSEDASTWMDDGVEVFVDGDNSNFETRDTTGTNPDVVGSGGQYVITANNAFRDAEAGNPGYGQTGKWYALTAPLDDGTGYVAEFRIALNSIGNPKPGELFGFTVAVNDDDDGAGGERQVIWVGKPHTESTYGNLYLQGRSYTAPKTTTAPTVDGVIQPNEYAGALPVEIDGFGGIYDLLAGGDTWPEGDCRFAARAVHTADSIYVAVDVTDDVVTSDSAEAGSENGNTWEDDSVEVFFDADNDKETSWGTTQEFEGQYVMTPNGAHRSAEAHGAVFGTQWTAATKPSAQGYQVEFKVMKSALLSPADGATLGFNIGVNDDDGAGRKAQINWNGRPHYEFTYGSLVLGGEQTPGGQVIITNVVVSGDNLELTVATPNPNATYGAEQSSNLLQPQWSAVANATVSPGANNTVTIRLPKPASTPMFYRVSMR